MFLLFNFNEIGDIAISNLNMHFLSVTNFKPLTSNNPEWFLFCQSKFDYQKMTYKNFSVLLSKFWKLRNQLNKDILKPVLLHEKIDWCWHKSHVKQTGNVILKTHNQHTRQYKFAKGQKQPPRGFLKKRCFENMQQIYNRTPMPKYDFNKVSKQLYWNHTSAWVFSCNFAAYFQNTFSKQRLWVAASERVFFKYCA